MTIGQFLTELWFCRFVVKQTTWKKYIQAPDRRFGRLLISVTFVYHNWIAAIDRAVRVDATTVEACVAVLFLFRTAICYVSNLSLFHSSSILVTVLPFILHSSVVRSYMRR